MPQLLHAPAKLNLYLKVTGKREDGYHLLETLSAFTEFGDVLQIEEGVKDSLKITGEFGAAVTAENNLVLRALNECRKHLGINKKYSISLEKNIPVGAGLGGGSADAAAIVRYFTNNTETAKKICSSLGADVFMCWLSRPALLGGIGDEPIRFEEIPLHHVVLVNPGKPLPTREVFEKFSTNTSLPNKNDRANDLTETAISIVPEISDVLTLLEKQSGCLLARMSGSGATCFALFDSALAAEMCEAAVRKNHPEFWIRKTQIKKAA